MSAFLFSFFVLFFVGDVDGRALTVSTRDAWHESFQEVTNDGTSWSSFVSVRLFTGGSSTARTRATLFAVSLRRVLVLNVRRVAATIRSQRFRLFARQHVLERASTAIIERVPRRHASSRGDVSSIHFHLSQFADALIQSMFDAARVFNRAEFRPRFAFA